MAGDWIKMRVDLADDPSVVLMSERLGVSEFEIIGRLHKLWSWADRHTTDGLAPGITGTWIDRYVVCPGFSKALEDVSWVVVSERGVQFPNFDRHNGSSAKKRVENTLRKRMSRGSRDKGETATGRDPIPKPFIRHVMARDNFSCVYCGTESSKEREQSRKRLLSIDHIIPASRGGKSVIENLACCCMACNREKNNRTPEEWGLLPNFLQPSVEYKNGTLVSVVSQESCDQSVTREEKRREECSSYEEPTLVGAINRLFEYDPVSPEAFDLSPLWARTWDQLPGTSKCNGRLSNDLQRLLVSHWTDPGWREIAKQAFLKLSEGPLPLPKGQTGLAKLRRFLEEVDYAQEIGRGAYDRFASSGPAASTAAANDNAGAEFLRRRAANAGDLPSGQLFEFEPEDPVDPSNAGGVGDGPW